MRWQRGRLGQYLGAIVDRIMGLGGALDVGDVRVSSSVDLARGWAVDA